MTDRVTAYATTQQALTATAALCEQRAVLQSGPRAGSYVARAAALRAFRLDAAESGDAAGRERAGSSIKAWQQIASALHLLCAQGQNVDLLDGVLGEMQRSGGSTGTNPGATEDPARWAIREAWAGALAEKVS